MEDILRRVKIFIADDDENIPLNKRILFESKEITTDLSDEDLLYDEIDFKKILTLHNEYRTLLLNEEKSDETGREIFLKPIKRKDLCIEIVNLVIFD